MTLNQLLTEISQRGVSLWAENDQLRVRAKKGVLTPKLQDDLARHKGEILALLHQKQMGASHSSLPQITPALEERYQPFPLTDMQHAFWVGRNGSLELGDVANHGYYEIECLDLDVKRLNKTLQRLIQRHDMLRAIVLSDGQQQVLEQVPPYEMEVLDLSTEDDETAEAKIAALRQEMSHQVLPTNSWPLFEFRSTLLSGERSRLHISYDLQIFDAWSLFRLFEEWFQLYQNPETELSPLELSFRDYVIAEKSLQETEWYEGSKAYWLERLDNIYQAPDLPLTKATNQLEQHLCKRYSGSLNKELWQKLKGRAAEVGLTPSGILLAAFAEVLTRWSRSPRFTISLALFNRLPLHEQVNDLLGDFTSVTLLSVDNSARESFSDRANRLQKQLWQDLEHRYFSGVRVMRELSRRQGKAPNAMPVVFTSTLGFGTLGQETSAFGRFGEVVYGISQASQVWLDHQVWEDQGTLKFNWDVVEELFPDGLLQDMFAAYGQLLQQLATDQEVWQEKERQLLPVNQLAQRYLVNSTATTVSDELLQNLFAAQVEQRSSEPAVITSKHTLNYQQLYQLSNQVGHRLRRLGTGKSSLVAVVMEKGWEQIVAVLGILASGAAYVPIDPGLPQERINYLLENSGAEILLTQSWLQEQLAWIQGVQKLSVDDTSFQTESQEPLETPQSPDDLAYVVYTSGSTGLPKGVMITHRNVVNVVTHTNKRFQVGPQDRILALTALNHDLSVYDIFGLLSAGGTIVMPDPASVKDPACWIELMQQEKVTLWNTVPAMMAMLVSYAEETSTKLSQNLRLAILGGDWLPVSLPSRLKTLIPNVQLLSIGGPTETTIWNIGYLIETVDQEWKSIPYGQPMANAQYHILNQTLEDCPVWVPGQMYCAGVQLAKGYWRNEEKTRANFITHPRTKERLYRTGDLGRYLPDGNIEFLGREDFQVKIRGNRIEIGEIEAALRQHTGVKEAVVVATGESPKKQLAAYVVPEADSSLFVSQSRDISKAKQLWQFLVAAGEKQARNSIWDLDKETFIPIWQYQDHLYTISVCQALRKLGVYNFPGENYTLAELMSRCEIAPRYEKWLQRALKMLVAEGWLKQEGEVFTNLVTLPNTTSGEPPTLEKKQTGFATDWLELLPKTPTANLAEIITEKIHSAEIYASQRTQDMYKLAFADSNAIATQVIHTIVQALESGQPLRILELGAGFGSTTAHLLPLLPPEQTTYVFTDISRFFLQNVQEHFANYPFIEYDILDLEKPPESQGYQPHSFDLVIAATVLHNTRSIKETLQHIRSLLAPNGLLLAIEKTRFHPSFDLNMGLQQGFERFADERLQQGHPLLSKEQWQQSLLACEFTDGIWLNESDSIADLIGFDVLVARGPTTVKQFQPQPLRELLQNKLPEYMIPSAFQALDTLPLTANGKVDRLILAKQNSSSQLSSSSALPQTETEKLVAHIWQEILSLNKVGVEDNFFELGGDSLQITQVAARLREQLAINLPVQSLFTSPTLGGLAKSLEQMQQLAQKLQAPIENTLTQRVEIEL